MPHDANGKLLKVGDKVVVPATIKEIYEGEEYCNCEIELDHEMPPYKHKDTYTLNTHQVVKVED